MGLPVKKQRVKYKNPRQNYVNVYFGLTPGQAQKLKTLAGKKQRTESEVLRGILDSYLKETNGKAVAHEPCRRTPIVGLKTLPRTITKAQDKNLRELSEKTGRGISALVRQATEQYFQEIS